MYNGWLNSYIHHTQPDVDQMILKQTCNLVCNRGWDRKMDNSRKVTFLKQLTPTMI